MLDRQERRNSKDARNTTARGRWLHWPSSWILQRIFRFCAILAITLYLGVAAAYFSLRYIIFPKLDSMRPYIEQCISDTLHAKVHIGGLTGRWSGLQPTIEINQLIIMGPDGQHMLSVPMAIAALSWRSLQHLAPVLSSLIVEQPEIFVEQYVDGTYTIAGVRVDPREHSNSAFLCWLMVQRVILLRGGILHWTNVSCGLPTLTFRGIRVAINNHGLSHKFSIQAKPDGHFLHRPIVLCARFDHSPLKLLTEPAGWSGTIFASSSNIVLPGLTRYIDTRIDVQSGILDAVAWFNFSAGKWSNARGILSGSGLRIRTDPKLPQLDVPSIQLDWSLRHNDIHNIDYTLNLGNIQLELGGQAPLDDGTPITQVLRISKFNGQFRHKTLSRGQLIGISGDTLDVGLLAQIMQALPLPAHILNALERLNPRGTLANYAIQIERRATHSREASRIAMTGRGIDPIIRYRINAEFKGVSLSAREMLPGAENIWGKISADQNGGYAIIDTTNAAVIIPEAFDNPRFTFKRFIAEATWITHPLTSNLFYPAVTVNISRFMVDNQDLCARASGIYSNPGHGYGRLDIEAIFDRLSLSHLARYLPNGVGKYNRAYLNHALIAGTARNATISIHGELSKFPYIRDPQAGILKIVAPFQNGSFNPMSSLPKRVGKCTPEIWPVFDGIDGLFWMSQHALHFNIQRAHHQRVILTKLTGHIDDLSTLHSDLAIYGTATGPLADMINYVNRSSPSAPSHHLTKILKAKGNVTLALRLAIPRYQNSAHIRVNGSLKLMHNTVSFVSGKKIGAIPAITQIHGKVDFTEHTITIGRITGQFLGGNIYANGWIHPDKSGCFNISGNLCTNAIRSAVPPGPLATLLTRVSGCAPYSVAVHTRNNKLPNILATADLSALKLQLPAPFTKQAGLPMPFSLRLRPSAKNSNQTLIDTSRLDAQLGPINLIYLIRRGNNNKPTIMHGAIAVNQKAVLSNKSVTTIAADLSAFDADAWRALLTSRLSHTSTIPTELVTSTPLHPTTAHTSPVLCKLDIDAESNLLDNVGALIPTCATLHFNTLTLLNRCWENIIINATKTSEVWEANIVSDAVSGYIAWHVQKPRSAYEQFYARLKKLVIPESFKATPRSSELARLAQDLPLIDLVVNDFTVCKHNLGKLNIHTRNIDENGMRVWRLDKLDVINSAAKLSVTVTSQIIRHTRNQNCRNTSRDNNLRSTILNFELDIIDGGTLLDYLGMPYILKGGNGSLLGRVHWQGIPTHIDYATLSGNLLLKLANGQILKIEPGAVKLLSVLSLQSLARLATLDLGALFGKGLPFYNVSANSVIRNGIARIDDFSLNSTFAKITLQGNVNFKRKQQNFMVKVSPSLSVDTVALATAAINPLLGLGTFISGGVLSNIITQSFERYYIVTGSWSYPQVELLTSDRAKTERFSSHASWQ
ncbi:YhdP family protein [Candidatus Vallotia tarda]|uniref:YhdP central domain-containing protein n=1 Tax=Candidatus Vallotiella hemipterorum TaxID=1177213 RepID=A0A916NL14_9BURK|nr:AsmA-like C-terminal region-containing protein [Candidatus Vallotia tarda]CAG7600017.1 Putative uncharacterized protein [Candidatus Vallotia tarda]